ncbi:hypothetical protein BY996DRAFT_6614187 [Phakopsora pachyrhizi]|nr:hypothetical protein BY996DRAFT_6614187 [Phakopsora pachyrhizi]
MPGSKHKPENNAGSKETAVTVGLVQEGDMEAKRRLKEEQAEAKRQANALPVWISQSHLTTSNNSSKNAEDANFDAYIARLQIGLSNSTLKMFDVKNASWLADFEGHRELGAEQEQLKISDSISNNGFSSDEQ